MEDYGLKHNESNKLVVWTSAASRTGSISNELKSRVESNRTLVRPRASILDVEPMMLTVDSQPANEELIVPLREKLLLLRSEEGYDESEIVSFW